MNTLFREKLKAYRLVLASVPLHSIILVWIRKDNIESSEEIAGMIDLAKLIDPNEWLLWILPILRLP